VSTPPALASFDRASVGYRFTLRYPPCVSRAAQGTVILAPAFAEEMNRCRRMVSLGARRLSAIGWRVWTRDLLGCGDSSGDFADASWKAWVDDLDALIDEAPADEPVWLWGVRGGALLLADLLARRPDANLLLWQPVLSGRAALTQFLRLKATAVALAGKERIDVKTLRAALLSGRPEEVAGYTISPSLAAGLEASLLTLPGDFKGRVLWLEVSATEPCSLAPAGEGLRSEWVARGLSLDAMAVPGEQFWQTQETAECAALLDATERAIVRAAPSAGARRESVGTMPAAAKGPDAADVPGTGNG